MTTTPRSEWEYRFGLAPRVDTSGMTYPMQCLRCLHVHDAGEVEVIQRYSDCSTWKCPNCGSLIDDRPRGWGGSAVRYPEEKR